MTTLRPALLVLALTLAASADALASAPSLPSIGLIDRGGVTTTYANNPDVRLADVALDDGGGGGAGGGNLLPAIVSFFIPGLGQIIWQNQLVKGVVLFLGAVLLNGALWNFLGSAGLVALVYHVVVAYDAWVGGSLIPNFGGGGGSGGDIGPDEREAQLVAMRVQSARPVER